MRIHTDHNGLAVNAISSLSDGTDVEGHLYQALVGTGGAEIKFQNGPVPENGVNGLTNEALLAVLIHRTKHLDGKFPCRENEQAINCMEHALAHLEARTYRRQQRGVEGKEVE